MKMPFGKHIGLPIEELPRSYLRWLTTLNLREPLRTAVFAELSLRGTDYQSAIRIPADHVPCLIEVLDRGRRAAAMAHHPDKGADGERMVRINGIVDALRSQLLAMEVASQ